MTYETLFPLVLYAFSTSITPGPNNLMLMSSGANFGLTRTLPHLAGISFGFTLMTVVIGVALMDVLAAHPAILQWLKVICFGFVLYLAWRILTSSAPDPERSKRARPLAFHEAAAFQWLNPKAIAMALTTITAYTQQQSVWSILLAASIFGLINAPSCSVWILLGQSLRRVLQRPATLRLFNAAMASLLVLSMVPLLLSLGT
ncbi:LysE family translocator [Cohaesibacter sp. CAU 1516]|uniref:LysE family translocator n=1 Tax=Cohaesibacter sp. CAU 1516 TaxID=2576038 RepID=UPI0010FD3165|nr:LysE family translocator [Cohaesibacter sp. CAU 1516]TLP48468.1 LysE family translocator [Cohaesibacter sp. CAU 1516]